MEKLSDREGPMGNSKPILLLLCIVLIVVSAASGGMFIYQSLHPATVTTTLTATSFQTETSISVSIMSSVSYNTVTSVSVIGTTTVPYAYAPCYGGYCSPYVEQFSNPCYSANSVGTQCTLYGFVQVSTQGCVLLSVMSSYNSNIYYDLNNWLPSYPTIGYVTVNGYISGPSSGCSGISFYVNSINH